MELDDFNFCDERAELAIQYGRVPLWLYEVGASANATHVYGYLSAKYGGSKKGIFPGQDRLAEALNTSMSTVSRAMKELSDLGALQVKRRGQGMTNFYKLMWSDPRQTAPKPAEAMPSLVGV